MHKWIIFLCLTLLFCGCQKPTGIRINPAAPIASESAKRYQIKGKVLSIDKTARKINLQHDDIPGFMEAMTMEFPVHERWVWDKLAPGVDLRGELVVDNASTEPFWIEKISISAADPGSADLPINDNFAQVGRTVPDFVLRNQDGKSISLNDFGGKTLAITFIYSKCPLPDYCIRMSTNFSDLARIIQLDPELLDKFRLLSVSFDPANDTPDKLRSYGIGYMGNDTSFDFVSWQLAVGKDQEVRKIADFFGLRYETDADDKTKINHSLRTAVIDPDGKLVKVISGNDWTPADLLRDMKAAGTASK